VQYLDADQRLHLAGRFIRVVPQDRMLTVEAHVNETYSPGDEVKIDLKVNRREPVDLVVSVYDQSLLGIAPDRSADICNFYLADERIRSTAACQQLRRRLGDLTLKELIERAEAICKEDPLRETPQGAVLAQTVDNYRSNNSIVNSDVANLLVLAGIDAYVDPFLASGWQYTVDHEAEAKSPVRMADMFDSRLDDWRLRCRHVGSALALFSYHPSNAGSLRQLAQTQGGVWQSGSLRRGATRGDAHFSLSANGMFSNLSGQSFISHMPVAEAPVELIDVDAPGVSVRRDFSDAAYWNARVRTDRQGRASVEFKLPDSLTNWRVMITGISRKMRVGQTEAGFRTIKPIMVWPMVPRIFSEGDRVELYASVHNRTDRPQEIDVSLKVKNGRVLTPAEVRVEVPAGEQMPVYWTFQPDEAGYTQLLMSAQCEAGSDASLKRLPVTRLAAEQAVTLSGYCRDTTTLEIPGDVYLDNSVLELTLVPSAVDDLVQSLDYLVEYPYGCVEQTMSRFLPAIKVAQTLDRIHVENQPLKEKLPGVVEAGVKRLLQLQQADGGWAWQAKGQTHEMMTPYALYGLLQAEKAGYPIPNETAVQNGLARLLAFINAMGADQTADRIYCTYVYSHREEVPEVMWQFIDEQLAAGALSDYALAMSLEMAANHGKKELAAKLAASLEDRAQRSGDGVYWTTAGFSRWADDRFEITAAALKALVAYDPEHELIPDVLTFFAGTKQGNRWNSTKSTAMVIYAMCDYLATQDYTPGARRVLSVRVNDSEPHTVALQPGELPKIEIPGRELHLGDNRIAFDGHVPGAMYRAVFRYWRAGRRLDPMERGLVVRRELYLLDQNGGRVRVLTSGDSVPRGAYVQSVVTASHTGGTGMQYVLVESPKPASAEILPVTDTRFPQPATTYALREDKTSGVVFHHERPGYQISDACVLHLELAGRYVLPPANVELMYETQTRGHSGTFELTVTDDTAKTAAVSSRFEARSR
ncbi:MAG TPA: alpha-2-macroglobulin family protein, partial [Thermoguttaceae bacterium]|nr:alpha-2-macroglobulin family protein [Thermoguttaceae bacterium]